MRKQKFGIQKKKRTEKNVQLSYNCIMIFTTATI